MNNLNFVTVQQVADLMGVCAGTVYLWCRNGVLKSYKFKGCRKVFIKQSDLEKMFEEDKEDKEAQVYGKAGH